MRKVDVCLNCREERPIVSHGLCANCNMRARTKAKRENDERGEPSWLSGPDQSQNRYQQDLNRIRNALSKMVSMLDELPVCEVALTRSKRKAYKADFIEDIVRICDLQRPQPLEVTPITTQKITKVNE